MKKRIENMNKMNEDKKMKRLLGTPSLGPGFEVMALWIHWNCEAPRCWRWTDMRPPARYPLVSRDKILMTPPIGEAAKKGDMKTQDTQTRYTNKILGHCCTYALPVEESEGLKASPVFVIVLSQPASQSHIRQPNM